MSDLWTFLRVRKKYWLPPLIVLLLLIIGLVILASGSVDSAFHYPTF